MAIRSRYGGEAYGGATQGRGGVPGSGLSVPGYETVYYWAASGGNAAYGQASYGGRRGVTFPSAGISATPDSDSGTVTIPLWWAYADQVMVSRVIEGTGERVPVRGAAPVEVTGVSHRNGESNPKAAIDLKGNSAGTNTALSRITGITPPVPGISTAFRLTASAAAPVTMTNNADSLTTQPRTYGFFVRTSALASAIRLSVQWYDAYNVTLATRTYDVGTVARTQAVGAFSWATVTVDSYPTDAVVGVVSYVATGLPAGGTVDITGRVSEFAGEFKGEYFDGDYLGASWTGTPGASYSDLAPIFYALDGEAPLDTPFHYEMTNPRISGFTAISETLSLSSRGNRTWLTHPDLPFNPVRVEILGPIGTISRSLERGVYYPLDSVDGLPIVRVQSRRRGRTGTLKFLAVDHYEWHRLIEMFGDGQPVLIRPPATYGYGASLWLSLGDLDEENPAYFSELPFRTLTAPFTEVAAPLVGVA